MRITDAGSSLGDKTFGEIDNPTIPREVYNRLQTVVMFPIGSKPEDSKLPLSAYFNAMNNIQDGNLTYQEANNCDAFVGSLGVDFYYPHPDNTYKGGL